MKALKTKKVNTS